MATRCKMRLDDVIGMTHGGRKAIFRCAYDEELCKEDASFSKATPSGMAEFQIDNPVATKQLIIGQHYYFDITPVPAATS